MSNRLLEKSREIPPERMKSQSHIPVVDVSGGENKVQSCKEQYCIGPWNVRSLTQGKLDVVKEEMARVNIDILGISELKWMEKGKFNSDYHYIHYCWLLEEIVAYFFQAEIYYPYKKWSGPHSQKEILKCSTWVQSQKQQNDLCSFSRQTTQQHSDPSLCPNN